jgi:hypothetical protein
MKWRETRNIGRSGLYVERDADYVRALAPV